MPCTECPHCRQLAERAVLVLSDRRPRAGATAIDLLFYREFAGVYDLAVARGFRQPMRAIREANPGLTTSQCRDWLRRARTLGLVRTPAQERPQPVAPTVPAVTSEDPVLAKVYANASVQLMLAEGVPISVQALEILNLASGEEAERLAVLLAVH